MGLFLDHSTRPLRNPAESSFRGSETTEESCRGGVTQPLLQRVAWQFTATLHAPLKMIRGMERHLSSSRSITLYTKHIVFYLFIALLASPDINGYGCKLIYHGHCLRVFGDVYGFYVFSAVVADVQTYVWIIFGSVIREFAVTAFTTGYAGEPVKVPFRQAERTDQGESRTVVRLPQTTHLRPAATQVPEG